MRFSLVTSVLGLSLAVIATPATQPQPDPSLITCENKLKANVGDIIKLRETRLSAVTYEGVEKADKMKDDFKKNFKDTFDECMKVTHVSSEEAAKFEDLIMEALAGAENSVRSGSVAPSTVESIITIYNHFHDIYPEDYKKSLDNRNAGTSPSGYKFIDLCDYYSFCISR